MTSNIGFEKNKVGFSSSTKDNIISNLKSEFSPSLINRIDDIIIFNRLTRENIKEIIKNKLDVLKNKYKTKIKINISNNLINEMIEKSNYDLFGARRIDKIISTQVEDIVIDALIKNEKSLTIKSLEKITT